MERLLKILKVRVVIKSIINETLKVIIISLGLLLGIVSFGYKMLILSDIPISFTTSEAIFSQLLFFVSTMFITLSLTSLKSIDGRSISLGILIFVFSFNLLVLGTDLTNDPPAVAQLQLAPVLHLAFLVVLNLFLLIKNWNNK
ncbi:hypothetical protein [Guptibacillus spartinae]|uniref:hypothetical protein n=1 Tax=Guptibacillus spartinae TaxID=3025679 RepID=UPI002362F729|nr:hypothetical protein [Pseudalkalibacillus spartinae]